MSEYSFVTLNVTTDGEGWQVTEGQHSELLPRVNEIITENGPPKRSDFVNNPAADVLHLSWMNGAQVRYVMHKRPGYERVFCPACRTAVMPPEWGGKNCHGWVFTWQLTDNMYQCTNIQKGE